MRTDFMASAKQIAWRKKFARMSKAGKFKKSKKSNSNSKPKTLKSARWKTWGSRSYGGKKWEEKRPQDKTGIKRESMIEEAGGSGGDYWKVRWSWKELVERSPELAKKIKEL